MENQTLSKEDSQWLDFRFNEHIIPTSFFTALIEGAEIGEDINPRSSYEHNCYELFKQRVSQDFVRSNLVFADISSLIENLPQTLRDIVSKHQEVFGDYFDVNLALDFLSGSSWSKYKNPSPYALVSYLTGSGLCTNIACLGVAISRANGFPSHIIGYPCYYRKHPYHHYGFAVLGSDSKRRDIVPRGLLLRHFIKNRGFFPFSDAPIYT